MNRIFVLNLYSFLGVVSELVPGRDKCAVPPLASPPDRKSQHIIAEL